MYDIDRSVYNGVMSDAYPYVRAERMTKHYTYPSNAEKKVSVEEAYKAAFHFLFDYWERDGRPDDSCAKLLSWMQPVKATGAPTDPAMWHDWITALQKSDED